MPNSTQLADVIRIISMDAVENAGCGHPGMPMGMADIAEVLWRLHLNHNPNNPDWVNRDRFILSNGHGSMLIYSLLHLTGYALSMDEIKNFRQLGSKTPGHPEYGVTPGVETTTGPLGQGLANGVGMALAEKILSRRFNKDDISLIDHKTYVFAGDGCLMEGISHEACSLAGTLKLGKLIVFYDNNNISIDGEVSGWFTEDIPKRFESYGWQVISGVDGHDPDQINKAIEEAKQESEKPTLIDCKTIIGKGSPNKEGSASSHGSALGSEESEKVREKLRWTYPPFEIPQEIYREWDSKKIGEKKEKKWNELFTKYKKAYPELSNELNRVISGNLFNNFEEKFDQFISDLQTKQKDIATRKSSELVLNYLGPLLPELLGGSADLSGSNNTKWQGTKAIEGNGEDGNYINYGVREFAMSAIVNGLVLHGGLKPYAGTFLTFLDYAKNAVRMSALMKIPSIFVYSHDSIGVGEDGPTHQPIEHLSSLRSMPNVETWRPCDSVETAATWKSALLNKDKPTAIILSRQNLRAQSRTAKQIDKIHRGGYVLYEPKEKPDLIIISTGSEIGLAMEVMEELKEEKNIRVVSMPCTERFDAQEDDYKKEVLLEDIPIISIEASHADWWNKYVNKTGAIVGMNDFGESAPGDDLQKHFGFTTKNILNIINSL